MAKKNKKKNQKLKLTIDPIIIPILMTIGILPLIVRGKLISYDTSELIWYNTNHIDHMDLFTHGKAVFLGITTMIAIGIMLKRILFDKTSLNFKKYTPVYIYTIILFFSTLLSINLHFSLTGYLDHLENVFILIAYMILFIYTSETITSLVHLKHITNIWILSIIILTLIGLTQFFGKDLFQTAFGIQLIMPSQYLNLIESVESTLWSNTLVYQTLFHYNYVSFYSAMAFPFFFTLLLSAKENKHRLYLGIISIVILFNMFASQGRNGLVGIILGLAIISLFYSQKIIHSKYTYITLFSLVAIVTFLIITTDTTYERRMVSAVTGLFDKEDFALNNIETAQNTISIDHDNFSISITGQLEDIDTLKYEFYNSENELINYTYEENKFILDQEMIDYSKLSFTNMNYESYPLLMIHIDNQSWPFILEDNTFFYLNEFGHTITLHDVPTIGFTGLERWGSMRGYIWSRTLPVILSHPLLGTGPDTFPLAFPQDDYIGKYNAYRTTNMVVDKPHNIFLDYASNTGLPSLLLILLIIGYAYYMTFKNFLKLSATNELRIYAVASLSAISGYLAAGMFNDTNLHVTPIFWILVGINYAVNRIVRQ